MKRTIEICIVSLLSLILLTGAALAGEVSICCNHVYEEIPGSEYEVSEIGSPYDVIPISGPNMIDSHVNDSSTDEQWVFSQGWTRYSDYAATCPWASGHSGSSYADSWRWEGTVPAGYSALLWESVDRYQYPFFCRVYVREVCIFCSSMRDRYVTTYEGTFTEYPDKTYTVTLHKND